MKQKDLVKITEILILYFALPQNCNNTYSKRLLLRRSKTQSRFMGKRPNSINDDCHIKINVNIS